jgi:magnesium chelatase subunit D
MTFPFAAVVGNSSAKLALMLLAVDKTLKGVLLSSSRGTAKSALARAAKPIFQNQNDDNDSKPPFIELPLGVTVDRLLGGLDFERTLHSGKRHYAKGLLAEAHGGVLFVDDVNLLDANISAHIAAALDAKTMRIEHDGLSMATGADFVLLGVSNSEDNQVGSLLRERLALIVESESLNTIEERAEIVSRVVEYQEKPEDFINSYDDETLTIKESIEEAKERLPRVKISVENLRSLSTVSMSLGVEGNRADIFASRVAKASAALAKRDAVSEADIITAIQLVLLPRATQIPTRDETEQLASQEQFNNDKEDEEQPLEPQSREQESKQDHHKPEERPDGSRQDFDGRETDNQQQQIIDAGAIEDLIIKAIDSQLPKAVIQATIAKHKSSANSSTGKRSEISGLHRGRYIRDSAKKNSPGKIAIAATLRAAAPFQLSRQGQEDGSGKAVKITADDLRYKRFKKRSGMLFIFAVDASGSMALNRMAQAKGAMTRLLQEAYIHRDKVALISFRNDAAEILLQPTRSIELAKRVVDAIPTGGATPVAAALMKALKVSKLARSQELSQAMLVLFTDGRANTGFQVEQNSERSTRGQAIKEELRQLGGALQLAGITSVVIDTKPKFIAGGEARELAETIGANYCYLPRANDKTIYESVSNLAKPKRNY